MVRFAGRFRAVLCAAAVRRAGRGGAGRDRADRAPTSPRPGRPSTCCRPARPGRSPFDAELLRPAPALRRAHARSATTSRRRTCPTSSSRTCSGSAACRCSARRDVPGAPRSDHHARQLQRAAHRVRQPRRRDVRVRLRDGRGPHAADGHAARPGPCGRPRRAGHQPLPARPDLPAVQPVPGDRGLPRQAGRPRAGAGRAGSGSSTTSTTTSQGINDFRTQAGITGRPWNRNDVIAVAALIGAVFGKGGGDEARRSQLLSALQDRLGERKGEQVWNDLREQNDPETSVSLDGSSASPTRDPNQNGQRARSTRTASTPPRRASAVDAGHAAERRATRC